MIRLVQVPSMQVNKAIDTESDEFNTCFYTQLEAPHLREPVESPGDLDHWLPLITFTQGLSLSSIPIIRLSRRQGALIIAASKSSLLTREINRMLQEDVEEKIAHVFRPLTYPPNGYFLRLDGCSPKDGVRGTKPIKCVQDIILRLVTSVRATNNIAQILERDHRDDDADLDADDDLRNPTRLYFLPHNPRMSTARKYHVFCPPPFCQISAISQYKWHEASMFAGRPEKEKETIMARIAKEAEMIHKAILETDAGASRSVLMRSQGFTFDVMYDEDTEKCCLIELNSFGTRSGYGSCLFHWLRDEDILYGRTNRDALSIKSNNGLSKLEVEFRILA